MTTRYSLHGIYDADISKLPFSASDYSRFKFGCKDVAREFGFSLAEGFLENIEHDLKEMGQIVVISSPYQFIPTATFAMKDYFVQRLNVSLMQRNLPVIQEARIYRDVTYSEDYGEMSAEERMNLIGNDTFYLDAQFLKGKTVLMMDDVYITGSHEKMVKSMLKEQQVKSLATYFLYFAQMYNTAISPKIENELNYHKVRDLKDVNRIIHNGSFLFNTRVVKFILNADHEEFLQFIHTQDYRFINTLSHLAIGNSYHTIDKYSKNLTYLINYNDKNSDVYSAGMVHGLLNFSM
jgi:hypothetical protein